MFSFRGDHVLDVFGGSGSTAIAAARAGRDSTIVDCEARFTRHGIDRLRSAERELIAAQSACHVVRAQLTREEFCEPSEGTVACGMAAPVESFTVPRTTALLDWAMAQAALKMMVETEN